MYQKHCFSLFFSFLAQNPPIFQESSICIIFFNIYVFLIIIHSIYWQIIIFFTQTRWHKIDPSFLKGRNARFQMAHTSCFFQILAQNPAIFWISSICTICFQCFFHFFKEVAQYVGIFCKSSKCTMCFLWATHQYCVISQWP